MAKVVSLLTERKPLWPTSKSFDAFMRSREIQGRGPKLLANRFHAFNESMKVLCF